MSRGSILEAMATLSVRRLASMSLFCFVLPGIGLGYTRDLDGCFFHGTIPDTLGSLTNLGYLYVMVHRVPHAGRHGN